MYITPHAIDRFRERTGSTRTDERVKERISRIVNRGKRVARNGNISKYSDGRFIAVVSGGYVLTVMPSWRK